MNIYICFPRLTHHVWRKRNLEEINKYLSPGA